MRVLVGLSRDSDAKQEQMTEQEKPFVDGDKQGALGVRDIAMKNLEESQQLFKDEVAVTLFHFK